MAGPRRSKRLQSCSKPDQDKVTKIARVSKDQETTETVVQGENKKIGESAMEGPLDLGVDRPSPKNTSTEGVSSKDVSTEDASSEDASSEDASPNHASEETLEGELRGEEWAAEAEADLALAKKSKRMDDSLLKFRRAIQGDIGLGYRQYYTFKEWVFLDPLIEAIADGTGCQDLPWDRLDEAVQQRFIGYSPCAQQLFDTPLVRVFMFKRWIWEIIDENFFTGKSQDIEWTSPYGEAQATMERFLREKNFRYDDEDLRFQYPNWRFTTINFYYSLKLRGDRIGVLANEIRIEPRCVVKILKKALGLYFPENPSAFLEKEISTLAKLIVEYELILDCGRQDPRLVFHDPNTKKACGFPFSARAEGFDTQVVMESVGSEDEAKCNGVPIELVVSPMLVFYGAPGGWDYHVPAVTFPMKVCVGYIDGLSQDEVIETEEDGEGDGEEEVKIIKDKEGGTKDEDEKKDEDEE
ncbi:hypothetical protein FMEXI_382 [Fusarium mexicanum]|uniref:Uncharacterized protein n=1 Tax=Fusarium mexicanum TaxID=751941 RepID=A0A8H5JQB5_9HYPO|nr:hypothetical protein FMEXI_382 [Fusarium mexicanum]